MASARAVLSVTVAFMWHTEVESVRPDWYSTKWCSDGSIIYKILISHHFKLFITANSKIWSSYTNYRTISNICKSFNDQPATGHLCQPIII
uniref:Putative secreted protein n=1 Tax=Panstrongylus lignarius TaxID=156445 RepID=A0A224Y3V7_9HEMI